MTTHAFLLTDSNRNTCTHAYVHAGTICAAGLLCAGEIKCFSGRAFTHETRCICDTSVGRTGIGVNDQGPAVWQTNHWQLSNPSSDRVAAVGSTVGSAPTLQRDTGTVAGQTMDCSCHTSASDANVAQTVVS